MKIYLAGKFQDKPFIRSKMDELINLGHTITHDWTSFETGEQASEHLKQSAGHDITGVSACDILIILMTDPKYAYRGSFTELGCALGLQKQIIIVCPDDEAYCRTNCFFHYETINHVKTWEECLDKIKFIVDDFVNGSPYS